MPANFTGSLAISGSLILTGSITTTGGITISGSIDSASFAATASSADNFFVRQNLTASSALFTGSITAQTLVVQTVTSSIVYSSGSNIFGNQLTDTQRFTGSMFITGSTLNVNGGSICATGNTCFGGNTIIAGCLGIGTATVSANARLSVCGAIESMFDSVANEGGHLTLRGQSTYLYRWNIDNKADELRFFREDDATSANGCLALTITGARIACFANTVCAPSLIIPNTVRVGTTYGTSAQFSFGSTTGAQTTANLTDAGVQCGILEVLATGGAAGNGSALILGSDTWGTGVGKGQIALKALLINGSGCGTSDLAFSLRNDPACSNLTERMRITSGGNVGIGTTSPLTRLDIQGGVPSDAAYGQLYIADTRAFNTSGLGGTISLGATFNSSSGNTYLTSIQGAKENNIDGNFAGAMIFSTRPNGGGLTERMRITSGGNVGINTSGPTATSTPHFFIGTNMSMFNGASDDSYIGSNFYYNSAWYYRTANAASMIQQNGGEVYFKSSAAVGTANGALTWCERMRLTCDGILAIKTTSTSAEANLFLGAQGTVEGGQLVLQKGTSCNCATHLDNYQDTFRIMSGTDTGSTVANVIVDHKSGGCVGINVASPAARLHIADALTSTMLLMRSNNNASTSIGFYSSQIAGGSNDNYAISHIICHGSTGGYQISHNVTSRWIRMIAGSGGVELAGTATSWAAISDLRKKDILQTGINNAVNKINCIDAVFYKYKNEELLTDGEEFPEVVEEGACSKIKQRRIGLIAQQIHSVLPEAVTYSLEEDVYKLSYTEVIPLLIEGIKEQQCQICTQSIIIDQLKTCLGII